MEAICDSCAAIATEAVRDALHANYEKLKGFAP
jgi:hypothetical protein